jgi:folate-binding protein YgfZ
MSQASQLRLTDWGVIRALGADAASFLHGQLTSDFAALGLSEARLAGFCSAKGRLLATMIGWKGGDDEILLALPVDLLPAVLKRLAMFVMRAKCKLSDASAELPLWGVAAAPGDGAVWSRTGDMIRLPAAPGAALFLQVMGEPPALPPLAPADWHWLTLESGLPWVTAATADQFVPQMLNLELLGGVNFKKGCYPGQEIVARSQYRGSIKRRTYLYETTGVATPGQEIFHSEDPGQPAGLVVNVATRGGQSLLLAETKIAALTSGSLHLGASDGALLTPHALPYSLGTDVTA